MLCIQKLVFNEYLNFDVIIFTKGFELICMKCNWENFFQMNMNENNYVVEKIINKL